MTLLKVHSKDIYKTFKKKRSDFILIEIKNALNYDDFIVSIGRKILMSKVLKVNCKNFNLLLPQIDFFSKSIKREVRHSLKSICKNSEIGIVGEDFLLNEIYEMNKALFESIGEEILDISIA